MIRNVNARTFPVTEARLGELLDSLSTPDDRLWPVPRWPPMLLEAGLRVGSRGGHGPVRYTVEAVEPGRAVTFRFDPSTGLVGTHGFAVSQAGPGRATLTHRLEARTVGAGRLLWPVAVRWMHEALIADALDRATAGLAGRAWAPRRLGLWVRAWRHAAQRMDA